MKKNQIQPVPKQEYKFTGWAIFNWGYSLGELPIHAKAMNGLRNPYAQPNGSR